MNYNEAISYLTSEATSWTGEYKTVLLTALHWIQNGSDKEKEDGVYAINDLYWKSNQVSDQCKFGQAVFVLSYAVDPIKPFPAVKI